MNFYKNKNVLVTGGNGFIGSFVVERLLKDNANVSIASRTQKKFLEHVENDVKFVKCDLLNRDDALRREKYFKTHYGKMFLKKRLKSYFTG